MLSVPELPHSVLPKQGIPFGGLANPQNGTFHIFKMKYLTTHMFVFRQSEYFEGQNPKNYLSIIFT